MSNENIQFGESGQDVDIDSLEVKVLIICRSKTKIKPIADFLARRGWGTQVTAKLEEAIQMIVKGAPDFVLLSFNHPNKKLARLPTFLAQTFNTTTIAFAETLDTKTMANLNTSRLKHKILSPISGPTVQRKIKQILMELYAPEEKSKSSKLKDTSKKDDLTKIRGAVRKEEFLARRRERSMMSDEDIKKNSEIISKISQALKDDNENAMFTGDSVVIMDKKKERKKSPGKVTVKEDSQHTFKKPKSKFNRNYKITEKNEDIKNGKVFLKNNEHKTGSEDIVSLSLESKSQEKQLKQFSIEEREDNLKLKEKVANAESGSPSVVQEGTKSKSFSITQEGAKTNSNSILQESLKAKNTSDKIKENENINNDDTDKNFNGKSTEVSSTKFTGPESKSSFVEEINSEISGSIEIIKPISPELDGFSKIVSEAIDSVILPAEGEIHKLTTITDLGAVAIKSDDYSGLVLVATSAKGKGFDELLLDFKKELYKKTKDMGSKIDNESILTVQPIHFSKWCMEMAEFFLRKQHKDSELGVGFISNPTPIPKVDLKEGKAEISPIFLEPNVPLNFKTYLYFKNNHKYFTYVNTGSKLSEKQKNKLITTNTPLYIDPEEVNEYRQNYLTTLVSHYISQYLAKTKKSA